MEDQRRKLPARLPRDATVLQGRRMPREKHALRGRSVQAALLTKLLAQLLRVATVLLDLRVGTVRYVHPDPFAWEALQARQTAPVPLACIAPKDRPPRQECLRRLAVTPKVELPFLRLAQRSPAISADKVRVHRLVTHARPENGARAVRRLPSLAERKVASTAQQARPPPPASLARRVASVQEATLLQSRAMRPQVAIVRGKVRRRTASCVWRATTARVETAIRCRARRRRRKDDAYSS